MNVLVSALTAIALLISGGFCYLYTKEPTLSALSVLKASQGGTGIGTATAGDVGDCLSVTDDSPFTYGFSGCAGGEGSQSAFEIATTSDIAVSQVAYITKTSGLTTLGSVATGTISVPTGLTATANRYVLGGNLAIALDTGYVIPQSSQLFGKAWELITNTFSQSALAPTTTQNIHVSGTGTSTFAGGLEAWRQIAAPYFHATSSTATSTFAGGITATTSVIGYGDLTVTEGGTVYSAKAAIRSDDPNQGSAIIMERNATDCPLGGCGIWAYRSRGNRDTKSAPSANDSISSWYTGIFDGTDYEPSTWILSAVDGTVGNNDSPGRIEFYTTADGSNSLTERVQINNAGLANFFYGATSTALTVSGNTWLTGITSAIPITAADGLISEYAGTSCTNQFVRSLSALGVATCATVGAADVSLANLTATDSTLTFSGTYNGSTARTIGLNLSNANIWTALQQFSRASSTIHSSYLSYFGGTATTTIDLAGNVALPAAGTLTVPALTSALILTNGSGLFGEFGGSTCTNQVTEDLTVAGASNCVSITDAYLSGAVGIAHGGLGAAFTDPNADRLMFWDDSAGAITGIATLTGAAISGTTLTINDVSCTDCLNATEIEDLYLLNNGDVGTGVFDFGGATSFEIVNGTAPTVDAIGEFALDTTDNQFIIATSTNATYPAVFPAKVKLWGATVASTSVDFVSGGRIWLPPQRDGFTVKEIHCAVDAGTSVVIGISNSGGTTDSETVTCDADGASDTDITTNQTYTAGSFNSLEIGTITGSVDYVTFSVWGTYTRE